uniref:mycothione reductase n=1 Tax=Paractinoplanes polyasparticus TaxID=2856853 RepID=UPI001C85F6A5|nr:mycothione reductase [Actinoplanes polyasparticus]
MQAYDVVVLGAGTGNMVLPPPTGGKRVAIVEPDRFGGTCLNRGCIPSKMFVVAADTATTARRAARLGVHASVDRVDWPAVRDRVFGRIDPLHKSAVDYRHAQGVDVFTEPARFVGPRQLMVGDEVISGETILVVAGSRPVVPEIPGLADVDYHTSDTIMRIDQRPESMIVIGGGFVAAELGYVFEAFGSDVTIVHRGPRLLMNEDEHISERFTMLAAERHRLVLNSDVVRVDREGSGIAVTVKGPDGESVLTAETLLVSVGRRPNTDLLDVAAGGLEVDGHGHLRTDEYGRTGVPGVWALGDVANHYQLKHMANAEGRTVLHNLARPDDLRALPSLTAPHAVFSEPQIASVGLTEQDARARGIDFQVAVRDYASTAYGWGLEDTTSFVKLLAEPGGGKLLGAHLIGPDAALLIQPLVQAMALGQTARQVAQDVIYIHPALTEVVEQALLGLLD